MKIIVMILFAITLLASCKKDSNDANVTQQQGGSGTSATKGKISITWHKTCTPPSPSVAWSHWEIVGPSYPPNSFSTTLYENTASFSNILPGTYSYIYYGSCDDEHKSGSLAVTAGYTTYILVDI